MRTVNAALVLLVLAIVLLATLETTYVQIIGGYACVALTISGERDACSRSKQHVPH